MNKRQLEIQNKLEMMLGTHYFSFNRDPKEDWYKIKITYDPINEYLVLNGYIDTFLLAKLSKFDVFIDDRVLIPCFKYEIERSTIQKRITKRVIETRKKHRKETQ